MRKSSVVDTTGPDQPKRPSLLESWGVLPLKPALQQARMAVFGAEDVPASSADLSSLGLLSPRLGVPLWLGRAPIPRKVILTNLFNHTQTPESEGWSTRRRQVRDFRGDRQTYDSHNGTDLCVPRGTVVVAPAPARVARVFREFNRGGLKIALDHGHGLMTCSVHLARALVQEGDILVRGQPMALSGYSGLDGFSTFPWGIPHVHFNTWLDTTPVDPFAVGHEASLWVDGWPTPVPDAEDSTSADDLETRSEAGDPGERRESFVPTVYDADAVDALIEACVTPRARVELRAMEPLWRRAAAVICARNYYPTRFPARASVAAGGAIPQSVVATAVVRGQRLHLPFAARDFDGVVFRDEIE